MTNLCEYKIKTIYSCHASNRMNQRAISRRLVDLIIRYANIKIHAGENTQHYQISRAKLGELFSQKVISLKEAEKLDGLYIIAITNFIDPIMKVIVVTTCYLRNSISRKFARYQVRLNKRRAKRKKFINI